MVHTGGAEAQSRIADEPPPVGVEQIVKQYRAYVYTRKPTKDGMVRLYLRTPEGKRCGYQDVTPATSRRIPAGEVRGWSRMDHWWKHRKLRHGTRAGYQRGCRCNSCKKAAREYRSFNLAYPLPELPE